MASKQLLFRAMYKLGFTPWDGHPLATSLRELIEGNGTSPLPTGTALEIGCGTGDSSIYLAQHGWQVTGVDFVGKALDKARAKAAAAQVSVNFVQADVTRLGSAGVGEDYALIVDNGCLHGMSDEDRDAYVREVTAVAAADARLLIVAFTPGTRLPVRGIDQAEIEPRFAADWTLLSAGEEPGLAGGRRRFLQSRSYLLQRRAS
jgi:SAM-dependent methyltransferase